MGWENLKRYTLYLIRFTPQHFLWYLNRLPQSDSELIQGKRGHLS